MIILPLLFPDNGYVEYDEFILLMKRWSLNAPQEQDEKDVPEKNVCGGVNQVDLDLVL